MRKKLGVAAAPRGNMGCEYYVMSCLPVAEVRPLSQSLGWAALLEPSWCVGVQA